MVFCESFLLSLQFQFLQRERGIFFNHSSKPIADNDNKWDKAAKACGQSQAAYDRKIQRLPRKEQDGVWGEKLIGNPWTLLSIFFSAFSACDSPIPDLPIDIFVYQKTRQGPGSVSSRDLSKALDRRYAPDRTRKCTLTFPPLALRSLVLRSGKVLANFALLTGANIPSRSSSCCLRVDSGQLKTSDLGIPRVRPETRSQITARSPDSSPERASSSKPRSSNWREYPFKILELLA
ncbi:hypothetical protein B0H11DRAFT_1933194 [Mycena galericulata]|nr:hypothetical protein B0H11DRAFT_1933194 [Mycena galericulata]